MNIELAFETYWFTRVSPGIPEGASEELIEGARRAAREAFFAGANCVIEYLEESCDKAGL
jgi:hypothetical protein